MKFRTFARLTALVALAVAAPARADVYLSTPIITFGETETTRVSRQSLFVANDGADPLSLTGLQVRGDNDKEFAVAASSTCSADTVLLTGERCRIDLEFAPEVAGERTTQLRVYTDFSINPFNVALSGTGTVLVKPGDPYRSMISDPPSVEYGVRAAGQATAVVRISLVNNGTDIARVDTLVLAGRNVKAYEIVQTDCVQPKAITPGNACYADVRFTPQSDGPFSAVLRLRLYDGDRLEVALIGTGGTLPAKARNFVIEFYNATLDHYFISSLTPDIVANDTGANAGWTRTGRAFNAFPPTVTLAKAGTRTPVCRYYIPPPFGDSHFYSASPAECAEVGIKFPKFTFESADVMGMVLPDLVTGACAASSIPVYRVWNQRADSNHRYTVDKALRDAMLAKGYVAEGYGPDGVAMCAPI